MTVILSPRALMDIADISERITRDFGVAAGLQFHEKVNAALDRLKTFPGVGTKRPELGNDLRSVAIYPSALYYRVKGEEIQVARVLDGRRDLGTAFFE